MADLMDVDGCERSIRSSKSKLHTVSRSFKYNENIAVQNRHHAEHAWDVVKPAACSSKML
jgi:hypothetical protein